MSLSAGLDSVALTIASANTLNLRLQLDLSLRLRVRRQLVGIPLGVVEGEVRFTNAMLDVDATLGIDATTGRPRAEAATINSLNSGSASPEFPGLEPELAQAAAQAAEEIVLASALGVDALGVTAGLFDGLLSGADIPWPKDGFSVTRLDGTGDFGVELGVSWGVQLKSNGLNVIAGLHLTDPAPPPGATGSVPVPLAPNPLAPPARASDVWSAVHPGVFNQVLQSFWRAGLFDGRVDGATLMLEPPAGASVDVHLGSQPVVTEFDPVGGIGLDIGPLELVVEHPDLPPGLHVTAGARIRARATLLDDDLQFDEIVTDELRLSTGAVALDAVSTATLEALLEGLIGALANLALNECFPVLPAIAITSPPSFESYGLAAGSSLIGDPHLAAGAGHVLLEGSMGW